jgi:hypothetical protein
VAAATGGSGLGSGNLVGPGVLSSILSGAASGAAAGFGVQREFFPPGGGAGGTAEQLGDTSLANDQLVAAIELLTRQGRI